MTQESQTPKNPETQFFTNEKTWWLDRSQGSIRY